VHKALREKLALQVYKAFKVQPDHKVRLAQLELRVLKASKAYKVCKVQQE
jgi:hypothetical protein